MLFFFALAAILIVSALGDNPVFAQSIITEIIDSTGDCPAGNGLDATQGIAADIQCLVDAMLNQ